MAIDTAEKRRSISGIFPFLPVGVTPNASQDVEWRQEAGWGYPGISVNSGAIGRAAHIFRTQGNVGYLTEEKATHKTKVREADEL